MPDFLTKLSSATGRAIAYVSPSTRRVLIGLFLVAAFALTTAVLLFVITAEQLQNSIATTDLGDGKTTVVVTNPATGQSVTAQPPVPVADDGGAAQPPASPPLTHPDQPAAAPTATTEGGKIKTSVGAIRQDVAAIEHYYNITNTLAEKQVNAEEALFQANIDAQTALANLVGITDKIRSYINLYDTQYIRAPLKVVPFQDSETGSDSDRALVFDHAVAAYFAQYFAALDAANAPDGGAARKSLESFKSQTYKSMAQYTAALSAYTSVNSTVQSLKQQIAALQERQDRLDNTIAPAGTPLANDAYWNLCEDFYSFKSLVGDWAYHIVLLPKMMLVLILSIFMGILGSLIYITQDFLKNPDGRGFWDILFRTGLGAGVAFALFFFAAAGMLALSQSPGGQTEMSPYLISFLGITGGYLSDRVTAWMRQVGENTFKVEGGDQPSRWAVGLDTALKATGLDAAALATGTGADVNDVNGWISLAKPVPGDRQALVAAFLRVHPSKVFTDIKPA